MSSILFRPRVAIAALLAASLSGCVLEPREAKDERARLGEAGAAYRAPFERRVLPELDDAPETLDVLRRALVADGELEAAYFEWAAAVARIRQAGAYPNSPMSLGFEQAFDGGRIKSFDQTSITAGPDAMENLAFPTKVAKAGEVAFDLARAAGRRFVATKLDVQRRVLVAWFDFSLLAERERVLRQYIGLLTMVRDTTSSRVAAGGAQSDLLKADVALRLANDRLATLRSQIVQGRATLNAMLARPADAPLEPPATFPEPRGLAFDDATLIAAAARNDPSLEALGHLVEGRRDALALARMQYIPDFNPTFGIAGGATQLIGLGVTLPTVLPRIEGMIDEARADLRGAEATLRQKRQDRGAALVAALASMRNSERQAATFSADVIPLAERVVASARRSYASGGATYLDVIDAQRTLLDARDALADARAAREKSLADVEALAGFDVETLASPATTQASTQEFR